MRVRSVQFLDPAVANVSEIHGRESAQADLLSRQYPYYLYVLRWRTVTPERIDDACGFAQCDFRILQWRTSHRSSTAWCRLMRIRSVLFLDPAMANVSSELLGSLSTHEDSLSSQYPSIFTSCGGEKCRRRNSTTYAG